MGRLTWPIAERRHGGMWTQEEDKLICDSVDELGQKWGYCGAAAGPLGQRHSQSVPPCAAATRTSRAQQPGVVTLRRQHRRRRGRDGRCRCRHPPSTRPRHPAVLAAASHDDDDAPPLLSEDRGRRDEARRDETSSLSIEQYVMSTLVECVAWLHVLRVGGWIRPTPRR